MRIPFSKADWPVSFNSIAKYIGRHWLGGKLKLSASRELTAKLMGYNSVHDVQNELLDVIPEKFYYTQSMASSMAVKAVLMFGKNPIDSFRLFSTMPWSNLDVWLQTYEYKQSREGRPKMIIFDEYHALMNYSTPALIADAFQKGLIPKYEFTINNEGVMYHRASFERLLELIEPSEQDIAECDINLSVEEYFYEHLLPNAWCSIEGMITRSFPDKPQFWLTPKHVEIKETEDGRFVLLNSSLSAYYPGAWEAGELVNVISALFKLQFIPDIANNCAIVKDNFRFDKDDPEHIGCHGTFKLREQVYYRRFPLNNYADTVNKPFIQYLLSRLTPAKDFSIPECIVPTVKLKALNTANTINKKIMASKPDGITAMVEIGISKLLKVLFKEARYENDILLDEPMFNLNSDYFEDEHEKKEAESKLQTYIDFCESLGQDVLDCMPELKPYYTERVIGHYFHERYEGDDNVEEWGNEDGTQFTIKAERHLDFFISLITDHLCHEFDQSAKGIASKGVRWLLTAVNLNKIEMQEFKTSFQELMSIYKMFSQDESVFSKVDEYCSRPQFVANDGYINHGDAYKPTFKKSVDQQRVGRLNTIRIGRKLSSAGVVVQQSLENKV